MFASYVAHDNSEEDGESDDVDSELYRQLHHCSRSAVSDHSASEHGDISTSPECTVSTSSDTSLCNLRNSSVSCGLRSETVLSVEVGSDLENSEVDLEDWMLLGGPEMEGDDDIRLNLEFRRADSGSEEEQEKKEQDAKDLWAISDKDKHKHVGVSVSGREKKGILWTAYSTYM